MFEILERELGAAGRGARFPRRARHPHADERRAAEQAHRPAGRRRPRRRPAHLQPSLGRSRDVRDARHDPGSATSRSSRSAGLKQDVPVALNRLVDRLRPRAHLRAGLPARGRRLLGRHEVSVSRHRRARKSSTSRTGSARSSRAPTSSAPSTRRCAPSSTAPRRCSRRRSRCWRSSSHTKASPASSAARPPADHEAWRQAAALSARRHIVWLDRAVRSRADGHAGDVPGPVDGGQGRLQDRARRRRRRRGRRLRAARARGQSRPRPCAQPDRLSLPRLLPRAVGPIRQFPARHPRPLDARQGPGTLRRARSHVEAPRINVTLATGISREQCEHLSLDVRQDPADVDIERLVRPSSAATPTRCRAPAKCLFRVGNPPDAAEVTS